MGKPMLIAQAGCEVICLEDFTKGMDGHRGSAKAYFVINEKQTLTAVSSKSERKETIERAAYTFRINTTFGGPNGLKQESDQS